MFDLYETVEFQVADTILQDESPFDFSMIMRFVNILSSRTPVELNGSLFMVGHPQYASRVFLIIYSDFFLIFNL